MPDDRDAAPDLPRDAVLWALPAVLGTVLGGLLLVLLGAVVGVVSLNAASVLLGALLAVAAGGGLLRLGERQLLRDSRAREAAGAARAELERTVAEGLAHVERLDAERATLQRKVDKLERRLAGKERQLARLQAFDAERRTLEPGPPEGLLEHQLTFDAVAAQDVAGGAEPSGASAPAG